jgi:site-specific DNA-methyltransferase (adenine-specific)
MSGGESHWTIRVGDCLDTLRAMPDASVDAVVTDPPYGLGREPDPREVLAAWLDGEAYQPGGAGFMGKAWDAFVPSPVVWSECLRVLKPGGHLLAFAGSRTYDWIVLGVRLAGFEVRDQLLWLYATGFPKSLDVSKAIDRAAGAEREVVDVSRRTSRQAGGFHRSILNDDGWAPVGYTETAPATEAARQWDGWGTALKPAHEPIVLARKPLSGTVASNVTTHGTGAINVDACRVGVGGQWAWDAPRQMGYHGGTDTGAGYGKSTQGRWPANVLHDGSPEVVAGFPVTSSGAVRAGYTDRAAPSESFGKTKPRHMTPRDASTGSAARFFYHAKASRAERERGLLHREPETVGDGRETPIDNAYQRGKTERRNVHPTVKPVSVMRWLVRLVTPPGGAVVDPFSGSGTTGIACALEGFAFIGCELSPEYAEIARARIAHAAAHPHEWDPDIDPPADDTPSDDADTGQTSLLDMVK